MINHKSCKVLIGVLALILIVSGGYAMKTAKEFQQEIELYETAQSTFVTIVEEEVPLAQLPVMETPAPVVVEEIVEVAPEIPILDPGISVDFDSLTYINSQVVGWIHIPQVAISYPVMQAENNSDYLIQSYDGAYSVGGSIFMDYRSSADFSDANTLVYGHNVNSGTMFSSLISYQDEAYARENPYVFMLTPDGTLQYRVCYGVITENSSSVYDFVFTEAQSYGAHLDNLAAESLYDLGVEVTEADQILTLSTCTNATKEQRFVVICKLETQ